MTPWTKNIRFAKSILAGLGATGWLGLSATAAMAQSAMMPASLPLYFEANQGQVDSPAQFIARGRDSQFLISSDAAQFVLCKMTASRAFSARAVRMQFVGANGRAQISGAEKLSGKINYLVGNNPARWQTGVATFAKLQIGEIYSGVNLTYYGNQRQLEYDFTVAPGVDSGVIKIHFDGADNISISPAGELVLNLGDSQIRQPQPFIYQTANGARQEISGGYKMLDAHTVGFAVGSYDHGLPLVIDPILSYSTYFGGTADDFAWKVAVDTNGFVYVTGGTLSAKLGTVGAFQTNYAGGTYTGDAFVAKFSNNGSNLVYYTYLGGSQDDIADSLALDNAGDVFLTGFTDSPDFPTNNALFPKIPGHSYPGGLYNGDAFIAELDSTGSHLVYSTYLGGSGFVGNAVIPSRGDAGTGIALDSAGNAYIVGYTVSTNFPVVNPLAYHLAGTTNALLNRLAGSYNAFLTKVGPGGTNILYSTYFGGTNIDEATGVAVDSAGNAYVTGFTDSTNFPTTTNAFQTVLGGSTNIAVVNNAFVAKFAPSGTNLIYSTFLGGINGDQAFGIAVDGAGNAYVTGGTTSPNFPNTATNVPGLFNELTNNLSGFIITTNTFLAKLGPNGTNILYSAVFGGFAGDTGYGVAVDPAGEAFVTGAASSTNFPTLNALGLLATTNSGGDDVFVTAFNTNGTALLYSVELGGANNDIGYGLALDPLGNAYIVGQTFSSNFRTNNALHAALNGPSDAFLAKIILTVLPPEITTQPTNQMVGVRSTVNLVVSATGTPPLSYQWQMEGTNLVWTNLVNGGKISGATNTTLTISDAQVTNSGNYQVVVTNYGGAVTSSVAVLTVTNVATVLTIQPTSQTVGVGSNVTFFVDGTVQSPFFLQWLENGTNLVDGTNSSGSIISGSTNDPLTIMNAQTNDSGTYWLVISNAWGELASSNAVLTVVSFPTITVPPTNQTVGLGSVVTFAVTAVGTSPLSYRWQVNGADLVNGGRISGTTNSALTITNAQTSDDGGYTVIVTNSVGSVTSAPPAVLTVLTLPLFGSITAVGGTNGGFILSGVGGTNGGTYFVLTSSNLSTPFGPWSPVATNHFGSQGQFIFTNIAPTNSPQQFYILQMQ